LFTDEWEPWLKNGCLGDLVTWLGALAQSKPRVILTHGEDEPRNALARLIQNRFGLASGLPAMGETIEL